MTGHQNDTLKTQHRTSKLWISRACSILPFDGFLWWLKKHPLQLRNPGESWRIHRQLRRPTSCAVLRRWCLSAHDFEAPPVHNGNISPRGHDNTGALAGAQDGGEFPTWAPYKMGLTGSRLEDHPMTRKWLLTVVSKSANSGYSPSKWLKWLVNGGY